jgi:hypothetical protein
MAALVLSLSSSAGAVDGIIEINQICAQDLGCHSGDSAGFPVTLTAGSYRLTSDLSPSDQNSDVILVNEPGVSIDLNGFAIQGNNTFAGPGSTCSAPGNGIGIRSASTNVSVSNGQVRGMGQHGIDIATSGARIERVIAEQNCGFGIRVVGIAIVADSIARRNGGIGFIALGGALVRNSVAEMNGSTGISTGNGVISGCVASSNGGSGVIASSAGSLVVDSTANANTTHGISLPDNSLVLRCSANGNTQRGISMTGNGGLGSTTANLNGVNVFGAPRSIACNIVGGAPSCP